MHKFGWNFEIWEKFSINNHKTSFLYDLDMPESTRKEEKEKKSTKIFVLFWKISLVSQYFLIIVTILKLLLENKFRIHYTTYELENIMDLLGLLIFSSLVNHQSHSYSLLLK